MDEELLKTSVTCSTKEEQCKVLLPDGHTCDLFFSIQSTSSANNSIIHLNPFQFGSSKGRHESEGVDATISFDCLDMSHKLAVIILIVHVVKLKKYVEPLVGLDCSHHPLHFHIQTATKTFNKS